MAFALMRSKKKQVETPFVPDLLDSGWARKENFHPDFKTDLKDQLLAKNSPNYEKVGWSRADDWKFAVYCVEQELGTSLKPSKLSVAPASLLPPERQWKGHEEKVAYLHAENGSLVRLTVRWPKHGRDISYRFTHFVPTRFEERIRAWDDAFASAKTLPKAIAEGPSDRTLGSAMVPVVNSNERDALQSFQQRRRQQQIDEMNLELRTLNYRFYENNPFALLVEKAKRATLADNVAIKDELSSIKASVWYKNKETTKMLEEVEYLRDLPELLRRNAETLAQQAKQWRERAERAEKKTLTAESIREDYLTLALTAAAYATKAMADREDVLVEAQHLKEIRALVREIRGNLLEIVARANDFLTEYPNQRKNCQDIWDKMSSEFYQIRQVEEIEEQRALAALS